MTFEEDFQKFIESYPDGSIKKIKLMGAYNGIVKIKERNCLDKEIVLDVLNKLILDDNTCLEINEAFDRMWLYKELKKELKL